MKILKLIMGFLAMILCFTGCQKEKTGWIPTNIGFEPYIGHDTRTAVESVPFPEDRSFSVWAFQKNAQSLYINNETIEYGEDGWLSSKLWPRTPLTFEACWPTDLNINYEMGVGIVIKDFDISQNEVDILYAKAEEVDSELGQFAPIEFDHILSRVEFRMKQSLSSEMSVRVDKIELRGFSKKGDFNKSGNRMWTTDGTFNSYVFDTSDSPVDVEADPIYLGEDFYAIPQAFSASIIVEYQVKAGSANWIPQQEKIQDFLVDWKPGTHYTYTLNLTETNLTYTSGISNWNNRVE